MGGAFPWKGVKERRYRCLSRLSIARDGAIRAAGEEGLFVESFPNGEGEIGGAGLDVYEFEPRMAQGLAELPNTVLLPHVGSATFETRHAMAVMATSNLLNVLAGEPALAEFKG